MAIGNIVLFISRQMRTITENNARSIFPANIFERNEVGRLAATQSLGVNVQCYGTYLAADLALAMPPNTGFFTSLAHCWSLANLSAFITKATQASLLRNINPQTLTPFTGNLSFRYWQYFVCVGLYV